MATGSGTGLSGVMISDGTRTTTTDASGNYTLSGVPAGSYTLTPSKSGYSFSPASLSVTVSGNLSAQNFTASPLTYSLSGRVATGSGTGLSGVTISDGARNGVTDATGTYTISNVPAGTYTLTPSRSGYSFNPASLSVSVSGNVTGRNFTGTPLTYSLSGRVADASGTGLSGVTISDGTRTATTDASGNYTLSGIPAGSYTLTPSKSGYSFSPASLSVTVSSNLTGRNFTATPTSPETGVSLAVVPASTTLSVGGTLSVTLEVRSATQPIDGAAFFLDFDPTVLEVLAVTPGTALPLELIWTTNNSTGQLDLVRGALVTPFPQGTFPLATVTFRARQAAPDGTSLGISRTAARQSDVTSAGISVLGPLVPATLIVREGLALNVDVQLEGRPAAPSPRWSVPLSVTLSLAGTTTTAYQAAPTTDQSGRFRLDGITPGTYTLSVKHPQTLRVQVSQALSGLEASVAIGPLPSGDANNDNRISVLDFSLLASTFGRSSGSAGYDGRADFNGDSLISLLDFSLLSKNFGRAGAAAPAAALAAAPSAQVLAQVVRDLTAGETFTLDVAVNAPDTGIDAAAVTLDFDPTLLEVLAVTGDPSLELTLQQVVDNAGGRMMLARGTLEPQLPTGQVSLARIQLRARTQAAAAQITLVDDGDLGQSAVTAGGQALPLAAADWRLTVSNGNHSSYLPLIIQ